MEENKKTLTALAAAGVLILVAVMAYPFVRDKIREYRQKDVSLAEEWEAGEEAEMGQSSDGRKTGDGESVLLEVEEETTCVGENIPEVYFELEGGPENVRISLWQSGEGTCYFFLPGFAKGKKLLLKGTGGGHIQIDGTGLYEGDGVRDILETKPYDFVWFDKSGKAALEASVVFMYSSSLPALFMTTASGETTEIDQDKNHVYGEAGTITLYDENGAEIYAGQVESVKGRGNSTWGLAKKPYQFRLCEKADFFGMGEGAGWNLLANGYDETRLRNKITLEMAKALGMAYVPDGQILDLYINDVYYGNYYLTEKIEVSDRNVAIRDMEEIVNAAYSPEELEKLPQIEAEDGLRKWTKVACEDDNLTGGYLFERELPARFEKEASGFITSQGDCYALKSPVYASENQVNYIAGLMQEFQDAVEERDGIHPVTGKHYSDYIDVTSFVQKYLVEEISKNYDGGVTSSFFYKPEDGVSSKIFAGPVWDYDVAFGNCNLDEIASNPRGITRLNDHVYGTDVFAQLYEKEDFYARIVTLYKEEAVPYLEYLLKEGIDQMVKETRASAQMDSLRWESLENRYQYYQSYDNDVRYLKYFIEQRMQFLNEVWLEGQTYYNVAFVVDDEIWQIDCVKEGEAPGGEPAPSRYSSLFMGWVNEEGVPFDRFKPVYEDMTFYAAWQELPVEEVILK